MTWFKCLFIKHKFRAFAVSYLDWDSGQDHIHKRRTLLFICKTCGKIVKSKDRSDDHSNTEELE